MGVHLNALLFGDHHGLLGLSVLVVLSPAPSEYSAFTQLAWQLKVPIVTTERGVTGPIQTESVL